MLSCLCLDIWSLFRLSRTWSLVNFPHKFAGHCRQYDGSEAQVLRFSLLGRLPKTQCDRNSVHWRDVQIFARKTCGTNTCNFPRLAGPPVYWSHGRQVVMGNFGGAFRALFVLRIA